LDHHPCRSLSAILEMLREVSATTQETVFPFFLCSSEFLVLSLLSLFCSTEICAAMPSLRSKILIAGQLICLIVISSSLYLGRDKLTRLRVPSFLPGSSHEESNHVNKNETTECMYSFLVSPAVLLLKPGLTVLSDRSPVDRKHNILLECDPRCASDTFAPIILSTAGCREVRVSQGRAFRTVGYPILLRTRLAAVSPPPASTNR